MKSHNNTNSKTENHAALPERKFVIAIVLLATVLLACIVCVVSLLAKCSPKYAYVRSADLITGYVGMKEAKNQYQFKSAGLEANLDTLEANFQRSVSRFNLESSGMKEEERKKQEENLRIQQQNLINYQKVVKAKTMEEDEKISSGILNQINSYVEEFGKANGYDIIFGTTTSGNLLYCKRSMDITEEVLKGLNASYQSNTDMNTKNQTGTK